MMRWWVLWRAPALLMIVMAGWWFIIRPLSDGRDWVPVTREFSICGQRSDGPAQGCVIDGDTLAIGFGSEARRIRLTGFDAPELDGACAAEREQALLARSALQDWLNREAFEWNGAGEPPYDQYGRELREVRRIGSEGKAEYLARHMIDRGFAGESGWGTTPRDWCS